MGPERIPNDQLIVLYPSIDIERIDVWAGVATTDPAWCMELSGYNHRSWNEKAGKMRSALGMPLNWSAWRSRPHGRLIIYAAM